MIIGLDNDGVIFNFVKKIHQFITDIPLHPTEVDVVKYIKRPGDLKLFNNLLVSPDFFYSLELMPDFEEVIPILNQHDVYIITARTKKVKDATVKKILDIGLKPLDVIFTHQKGDKLEELDGDVLIDDQVKYAKQVSPKRIVLMPINSYNYMDAPNVYYYKDPMHLKKILGG